MLLARRNLARDPVRLALSVVGVAVSVALILLLAGYREGVYTQAGAYLEQAPGEAVVAERGIADFLGTTSVIQPGIEERVSALPGVARVVPIVTQFVVFDEHGRKDGFFLVGYDPARGGGPWALAAGREPQTDSELVVDATSASKHGIGLGGQVRVLDRDLTVVGLSADTTFWAGSLAFARLGTLESLLSAPGLRSFLLVTTDPDVAPVVVETGVRSLGVDLVAKSAIVANDRRLLARVYDAPIGLMVLIAYVVGVLVVGLVIYTATQERRREYGALKAIGARNAVLYRVVAGQALLASVGGAITGVVIAVALARVLMLWRPQFRVDFDLATLAIVVASSLVMALVAALAPARSLGGLAPAEVFRG